MRRIIAMLAPLAILCTVVQAAPQFDRFQALIGVDDGAKGRSGEGIFRVQVDGKEVFKSDTLLPGNTPIPVDISVSGASKLALFIDDEGDGHGGDWGDWLDARLVNSKTGETLYLTDLIPEEKAWIPANRDRNIIQNKLSLDGKIYPRGLGCISGSEIVYRNWDKVAAERETSVDKKNAEASKRIGEIKLRGDVPPKGLSIIVGGKLVTDAQLKAGIAIAPGAVLTVTTNPTDKAQTDWWKAGKCRLEAGSRSIALIDAVQPTDRCIVKESHPNRNVLSGEVTAEPQAYLIGKPVPPTGTVTFGITDIPLAFERSLVQQAKGKGTLLVRVKPYKTTEVAVPTAVTSSLLTVKVDEKPVAYVFSDNTATWTQSVAINDWPNRLECVTTPGADGSLGDGFVIDLGVQLSGMKEPLWVSSIQPSYSKFDFRESKKLLMAGAWQLPGSGVVRWNGLADELTARKAGLAALETAKPKIKAAKDKATIDAAVAEVLKADPKQPEIRILAAERFKELNDLTQERRQWGLLAEECRVDLALMQKARTQIDAIWDKMDPAPFVYPDDNSPTRSTRALGKRWNGFGDFFSHIWTASLSSDNNWKSDLKFASPNAGRYGFVVNSMGVEVKSTLSSNGKVIAERTAKQPMLDVDLAKAGVSAGDPLTLTVTMEPDVTGIILPHNVELAAWQITSDAGVPTEQWDMAIDKNGAAVVTRTSKAPVLAAIPRTATDLTIEGADGYTIQEPITEYLVQWDGKLGGVNLPLFAVPAPGKELKITYRWSDAASNIPMSKGDWSERRTNVFLQGPASILDTDKKSVWRLTSVPKDWNVKQFTPQPTKEDPNLFLVDPQGGLNGQWEAKDVLTSWMAMNYKNLIFYCMDNPNNRRWFPLWMKYVRMIYDQQVIASGHEHPVLFYIAPTVAAQLSGYGGGTVSEPGVSETWIASTGRMAPCTWRHGENVTGVDSHELHWVNLICRVPGSPTWTENGFSTWLEEVGWRCTDLANCEQWGRVHLSNIGPAIELIKASKVNPMQIEGEAWGALPGDTKIKMISLGWYISDQMCRKYGPDFWGKFWKEEWNLYSDVYPLLSDKQKHILFVNELVRVSGDPSVRDRFTKEWLFDLTPDPQDLPDRFLILPRQPKVTTEDKSDFASPSFDDSSWAVAYGPGEWQEKVPEMKGYNGVAWYRFEFDVPADFKTENLELVLGKINNVDEAYLNGVKVGSTGDFPPNWKDSGTTERTYKIKQGLLKTGQRNVLSIRVYSNVGSGAIYERPRLISRIVK